MQDLHILFTFFRFVGCLNFVPGFFPFWAPLQLLHRSIPKRLRKQIWKKKSEIFREISAKIVTKNLQIVNLIFEISAT